MIPSFLSFPTPRAAICLPCLESGWPMMVLTNWIQQKWCCTSSQPGPQKPWQNLLLHFWDPQATLWEVVTLLKRACGEARGERRAWTPRRKSERPSHPASQLAHPPDILVTQHLGAASGFASLPSHPRAWLSGLESLVSSPSQGSCPEAAQPRPVLPRGSCHRQVNPVG